MDELKKWRRTFPNELLQEINTEYDLFSKLLNINEDSFEELERIFEQSIFASSREKMSQFVTDFLLSVKFRPENIEIYSNFTKLYVRNGKNSDMITSFKELMHRALFCSESVKTAHVVFLYQCMLVVVFDMKEIAAWILEYEKVFPTATNQLLLYFAWFLPEFEADYESDFERLLAMLRRTNEPILKSLEAELEYLRQDDWREYKTARASAFNDRRIAQILRTDNVSELEKMFSLEHYDLESEIEPSFFEREGFLQHRPKCVHLAAYYGSEKCFEYLVDHHVALETFDKSGNATAVFAAVGSDAEILRKLRDLGTDFTTALPIAALFHNNDTYEWLQSFVDQEKFMKLRYLVLQKAVISNNIPICVKLLEEGINFNEVNVLFEVIKFS